MAAHSMRAALPSSLSRLGAVAALGLDRCDSTGIGKPEALKFELAGCWSRRITQEHRLVYRVITDRGSLCRRGITINRESRIG